MQGQTKFQTHTLRRGLSLLSDWKTNGFLMTELYLGSKAGLGFGQCHHPHFVLQKREQEWGREREKRREGGDRSTERRERNWSENHTLRRDQNPQRCTSQHSPKVLPNRASVSTPEADGVKNLQHSLLPNWIGACNGRKLFLRTEMSGAGKRRPARQAAGKQNWRNRHPDSAESKSCLALIHPGHGEACIVATCDFKHYYSFGHYFLLVPFAYPYFWQPNP